MKAGKPSGKVLRCPDLRGQILQSLRNFVDQFSRIEPLTAGIICFIPGFLRQGHFPQPCGMFDTYTKLFEYLATHTPTIRGAPPELLQRFAGLLRKQSTLQRNLAAGDFRKLKTNYFGFVNTIIDLGLQSPPLDIYFSEFLEGEGLIRTSGSVKFGRPLEKQPPITKKNVQQIQLTLEASKRLADLLDPTLATFPSIEKPIPAAPGRPKGWTRSRPPESAGRQRTRSRPVTIASDVTPSLQSADESPAKREIVVTAHDKKGGAVTPCVDSNECKLRFRVTLPTAGNLAEGDLEIAGVPKGGLQTRWLASSDNVEILEISKGTCDKVGNTWRGEFRLHIPDSGESETVEMKIRCLGKAGLLSVVIYDLRDVSGQTFPLQEIYRAFNVNLGAGAARLVENDGECVAPLHLNVRPVHEWTTPQEHVQVAVMNGLVSVTTKRGPVEYSVMETWSGIDNRIAGPISDVRDKLEKFRAMADSYLNDIDPQDVKARLSKQSWKPYSNYPGGWQPLPSDVSPKHQQSFDKVQSSQELRDLASSGYTFFESCFPQGSQRRTIIDGLAPGSRVDFLWTETSGAGWVSHVPWSLMYMDAPDPVGGPIDCERFLGLRFRIANRSRTQQASSLALGDADSVYALHLLYWGNLPSDEVGVESRWQVAEYRGWPRQHFIPDPAQPDAKIQVMRAIDTPSPAPAGLLYMYCHCSVGDGSQPVLRFGNTSQMQDVLKNADISQKPLTGSPLVFANACTTAASDPHLTSVLEDLFFRRGVRAFIGTETKVPIQLASRLAWLFFQFFYRKVDSAPMSAGEALTQARMFLWTQYRNLGGLFYCLVNQYDLFLATDSEVQSLRQ
jgi:hypothetical protein